jgi:hypothetical protein
MIWRSFRICCAFLCPSSSPRRRQPRLPTSRYTSLRFFQPFGRTRKGRLLKDLCVLISNGVMVMFSDDILDFNFMLIYYLIFLFIFHEFLQIFIFISILILFMIFSFNFFGSVLIYFILLLFVFLFLFRCWTLMLHRTNTIETCECVFCPVMTLPPGLQISTPHDVWESRFYESRVGVR